MNSKLIGKYVALIVFLLIIGCKEDEGKVVINTGNLISYGCNSLYSTPFQHYYEIGLGYTSTDVVNDAFLVASEQSTYSGYGVSTHSFTHSLKPGIYYYKVSKRTSSCTGVKGTIVASKSGSFIVKAGETTTIKVDVN